MYCVQTSFISNISGFIWLWHLVIVINMLHDGGTRPLVDLHIVYYSIYFTFNFINDNKKRE